MYTITDPHGETYLLRTSAYPEGAVTMMDFTTKGRAAGGDTLKPEVGEILYLRGYSPDGSVDEEPLGAYRVDEVISERRRVSGQVLLTCLGLP